MKYLLILLFLLSCNTDNKKPPECTTVVEMGSCDILHCAVKFANGISYYHAGPSLMGDTYCKLGDYWFREK